MDLQKNKLLLDTTALHSPQKTPWWPISRPSEITCAIAPSSGNSSQNKSDLVMVDQDASKSKVNLGIWFLKLQIIVLAMRPGKLQIIVLAMCPGKLQIIVLAMCPGKLQIKVLAMCPGKLQIIVLAMCPGKLQLIVLAMCPAKLKIIVLAMCTGKNKEKIE